MEMNCEIIVEKKIKLYCFLPQVRTYWRALQIRQASNRNKDLQLMIISKAILSISLSFLLCQVASAMPAVWTSVGTTSATGSVSGVGITATTSSTALFDGTATHRFAQTSVPCGGWDAVGYELDPSAAALTTTWVNGGDFQQFDFDKPWFDGIFYIENFDSSSVAMIMVSGGAKLELLTASSSMSFDPGTSTLSTSNTSFNGEGDAAFRLSGPVTSIRVDYKQGEQANGIFYTFADGGQTAVPEPTSVLIWGGFAALFLVGSWRAKSSKCN